MHATADSKVVNVMGQIKQINALNFLNLNSELPSKHINKWPAIKLAVRRTHNVIGRIKFLTISIMTINAIRGIGVPCGSKCESMCLVFLVHPNIIKDNQNVRERGRVTLSWEVGENTWGYKAKKFKMIIVIKEVIINKSLPFSFFPNVKFTSFLKIDRIFLKNLKYDDVFFHILIETNRGESNKMDQAREINELLGSNTENKLFIILLFFLSYRYFFYSFFLNCDQELEKNLLSKGVKEKKKW